MQPGPQLLWGDVRLLAPVPSDDHAGRSDARHACDTDQLPWDLHRCVRYLRADRRRHQHDHP